MPRVVTLLALGLVVVGVVFPLATGTTSVTAWIPAMLGGAILGLHLLCCSGSGGGRLKVALLLLLAGIGLVACVLQLVKGGFDLSRSAQQAQGLTAALCLALIVVVLWPGPKAPTD